MGDYARAAMTVAAKDLRIEWRTRTAFVSALVFAILVLAILYFARDPSAVSSLDLAPGALWITITFAAMIGLNRGFQLEAENHAFDGILLTPAPRSAVFVGKTVANLAFVGTIELVTLPLFVLFYDVSLWTRLPELLLVMLLATVAFVTVGTLLSSMTVRTRFAELMLPILLLPFLVPPVIGGVQLTARILSDRPLLDSVGWLKLLAAFDIAFCAASVWLFEATIDE